MAFDPAAATQDWYDRLRASQDKYKRKVAAVTEAPGQKAAAQQAAMRQHILDAIDSGLWARNVAAVPLGDWKAAATAGASRLVDGATKGRPKVQRYLTAAAPRYAAAQAAVHAMPNVTDADKKARMNANYDAMKAMKGIGKGGG